MKQKRLFLSELFILAVVIAMIIGLPFFWIPPDPTNYFQASLLKSDLLKNTPSPRLIVIGGSNVAFGVDSEALEVAFDMPVINIGLHGGLGEVSYWEVSEYLRPGDIVLLMPEYHIFTGEQDLEGNDSVLAQWMEYDISRVRFISPERIPTIILTLAQVKTTRMAANLYESGHLGRGIYLSKNFNDNGDFIGHLTLEPPVKNMLFDTYLKSDVFSTNGFQFLENFNLDSTAKGAKVFFEFPASRKYNCKLTGIEKFTRLYHALQERTTIPILTPPGQICFPDSYFFDTPYHLNATGRRVMTERLIKDLAPVLP